MTTTEAAKVVVVAAAATPKPNCVGVPLASDPHEFRIIWNKESLEILVSLRMASVLMQVTDIDICSVVNQLNHASVNEKRLKYGRASQQPAYQS